jgi:hypothetical protein
MRVREIQKRMRELASIHDIGELRTLADELSRRRPTRVVAPTSSPMTADLRDAIRSFASSHPACSQQAIAERFRVNPGRVSEALRGKRQ